MKKTTLAGLCLTLIVMAAPAYAQNSNCQNVTGRAQWTLIPSPNDPIGRVLGPTIGDLKASVSAYLTTQIPTSTGAVEATSTEIWVLGPQDMIIFAGKATFTPIEGQPIGTVADNLTLTAIGGTGLFNGATGTLQVTGIGYNLFGPLAAPGNTYFAVNYKGTICRAHL